MRKEFNQYVVWLIKELEPLVLGVEKYPVLVNILESHLECELLTVLDVSDFEHFFPQARTSFGPFIQDCLCFLGAETSSLRIFDETTLPELFDTFARTACFLEQDLSKYNQFYEIAMKQYLVVKDYVDSASAN